MSNILDGVLCGVLTIAEYNIYEEVLIIYAKNSILDV